MTPKEADQLQKVFKTCNIEKQMLLVKLLGDNKWVVNGQINKLLNED